MPVYMHQIVATFDTPVPCNGSDIFEVTKSNGTAEMAQVRRVMTWYIMVRPIHESDPFANGEQYE